MGERGQYVAILDIGTTGTRSIIYDLEARTVGTSYTEYPTRSDFPQQSEQDPLDWWRTSGETMREAIRRSRVNPKDIVGLGVCTQRAAVCPVDKNGEVLYPALTWMDARESPSYKAVKAKVGQKYSIQKIYWIKDNYPEIFEKAYKFVSTDSYIYFKLTGIFGSDYSNSIYGILDPETLKWSDKMAGEFGIPVDKWPDLYQAGTIIGEVTKEAAKLTGLMAGTPVCVGGGDQQCACVGVGAIKKGIAKATTGTGTFVDANLEKPIYDPLGILFTLPHVLKGRWILEGVLPGTGAILKWFRDEFCHQEKTLAKSMGIDPYAIIEDQAETVEPGSAGLFVIPLFNFARGQIVNLSFAHTRRHVARAIMEGTAYGMRGMIDLMAGMGVNIEELRIDGGGARSPLWRQIQADIVGKKVVVPQLAESTSVGAAILTSCGTGCYKDIEDAVNSMIKILEERLPDSKNQKIYNEYHPKFMEILLSEFSKISR
ncbi:MAG: FGGY family carbohydrate kinase [Candidatus Jordarchaeaceae archaeon]